MEIQLGFRQIGIRAHLQLGSSGLPKNAEQILLVPPLQYKSLIAEINAIKLLGITPKTQRNDILKQDLFCHLRKHQKE